MKKPVSRAMRKRIWMARLYVALLSFMLTVSLMALLAQKASATVHAGGVKAVSCTSQVPDPAGGQNPPGVLPEPKGPYSSDVILRRTRH